MQAGLHIRITRRLSLFIGNWSFCVGQCWSSSSSNRRFARPHFSVEFQLQKVLKSRWARLKTSRKLWAPPAHRLVPELVTFGLGSFTIPLRGSQGSNFDPYPLRLVPFRTVWKTYLYFKDYFKDIFYLLLSTTAKHWCPRWSARIPPQHHSYQHTSSHPRSMEHHLNISRTYLNMHHRSTFDICIHLYILFSRYQKSATANHASFSIATHSNVQDNLPGGHWNHYMQWTSKETAWATILEIWIKFTPTVYTHCLHPLFTPTVSKVGPRWVQGGSNHFNETILQHVGTVGIENVRPSCMGMSKGASAACRPGKHLFM